jgi:hypothetical protein
MRKNNIMIAIWAGGLAAATMNLMAQGDNELLPPAGLLKSAQPAHYSKQAAIAPSSAETLEFKASSIIGLPVCSVTGDRLGKVEDLIVNLGTHSTPFAIVAYGGKLAIGGTRVAVPLTVLKWSSEPKQLILPTTKEQFQAASSAPTGGWMAVAGEDWARDVDRFYGQPPAISSSRFERQEMSGMSEGREAVRDPSDQKGASSLEGQPLGTELGATKTLPKSTDEALKTKVQDLVRQQLGDRAGLVQVAIAKGVVTLNGAVASDTEKKTLVHQIMGLPGVARVEENLTTQNN